MENYLRSYIFNSILIISAILFIVYGFFNLDFLKGNNIDEYTNDYCQLNPSSLICKNKYKKNKFIWIFVDGNAYDQLVLLSNKNKYKIPIIFRGKGKGYKHTSQLFSEMFSGVPSRNMKYNKLKTDQIFTQLNKANYTMNFLGMSEPVNNLCGKDNKYFKNKRILKGHEKCSFCDFCNVTYPYEDDWCLNYYESVINRDKRLLPNITKEKIYLDLDKHFKKDNKDILESINLNECFQKAFYEFSGKESLVYYNTEIDKYNHLLTKEHIKTIGEEYVTENWLIKIMKWIDEHPDYALIVNSDHGGQRFYGEDDINNHGLDIDGNEAILFIYTKEFKDNYDKLKLDNIFYTKVDPSSIISQIMENVNIPLQSEGIAYPIANDPLLRYTAYKSKEVQLINQLNIYKQKYPNYGIKLNKLIDKLQNSEFYKVKEKEYGNYFDEKFTDKAINYLKEIQKEIIQVLKDINKDVFEHQILFLGIAIIYSIFIIYQIYQIFQIIKEDGINFKIYLFILIISLFSVQCIHYFAKNYSIFNRLTWGVFVTPFCLVLSNISINLYFSKPDKFYTDIIIILIGIISIIFHYSKAFIYIKEFFSAIIKSRILNVSVIYPSLFFELNYSLNKNFLNTNMQIFKYSMYNVIRAFYYLYIILLFLFDMSTDNYFFVHTPFNYSITISIYVLLFILFVIGILLNRFYADNNINKHNNELIKIVLFLYQFYINDESNRLIFLIMFILFEYFSELFDSNTKKINKIIISIIIIYINELFYLLANRTYSLESSKKYLSKTLAYSFESCEPFNVFLEVVHKLRFSLVSVGYYLKIKLIKDKDNYYNESFILRFVLNIRCYLNFIFFAYQFIYLKNNEDYMTLMLYSLVDLSVFLLDFINNFISTLTSLVSSSGYEAIKDSPNK